MVINDIILAYSNIFPKELYVWLCALIVVFAVAKRLLSAFDLNK